MNKPLTPESPTEQTDEPSLEDSFYEVPAELREEPQHPEAADRAAAPTVAEPDGDEAPLLARRRFPVVKVGLVVGLLVCVGVALMAFRAQGRRRAVREGIARADELMRLDTAEAYHKAADLLAPHAQLDPLEAGSARAFALAMLAADYRDAAAEAEANALLVVPGRADTIPAHAALAFAALAIGRNVLGDATSALSGASTMPSWASALQARIALRAGTLEAAVESADAAAAEPGFAPGLAVHGDAVRRARHDDRTARAAYEAALSASPTHPRAAFGLAKLALSGHAPEAEAREALERLVASGEATPAPERGRALLHLAALRLRAGEAVDAVRKDVGASVGEKALDWFMGAARAEAANKGPYRAVGAAPPSLESASDDDPPDLRPLAPEPPPPPPPRTETRPPAPQKSASHAKPGAKTAKAGKASAKPTGHAAAKSSAKKTSKKTH